MANLRNTTINTTTANTFPNQTTSTSGAAGKIRYQTTSSQNTLEFFDGTAWRPITGYSQGILGSGGQQQLYVQNSIVHLYTTVGTSSFTPAHTGTVQVIVVAGGGGSGYNWAGGGGGGGVQFNRAFPVSAGSPITVTVGGGGTGGTSIGYYDAGYNGGNSVFGPITAQGGGGGGSWIHSSPGSMDNGNSGGRSSGTGGGGSNTGDGIDSRTRCYGGRGAEGQGYPGGSGLRFNADTENTHQGGGGGGAGGPGGSAPDGRQNYRGSFRGDTMNGGEGRATNMLGGTLYFGGGGGGGGHLGWNQGTPGGIGGGGAGSFHHSGPYGGPQKYGLGGGQSLNTGQNGQPTARGGHGGANSGGGGGGGQHGAPGGSGVVIIKY